MTQCLVILQNKSSFISGAIYIRSEGNIHVAEASRVIYFEIAFDFCVLNC